MELYEHNRLAYPEDIFIVPYAVVQTARVHMSGITYPSVKYIHAGDFLPHYVFEYIVSGKGYIIVNNRTYTLEAGDLCITNRETLVTLKSDRHDPYMRLFFCVSGPLVDKLCTFYEISGPVHIKKHAEDARPFFEQMFDSLKNDTYTEKLCNNIIFNVITCATDKFSESPSLALSEVADKTYDYIQKNFAQISSLDELCKQLHISKSHIIHQYKKKFGVSPYQTIKIKRLRYARELLLQTDTPVSEIASIANFNSTSNFIKQYKTEFGTTPARHRANVLKTAEPQTAE